MADILELIETAADVDGGSFRRRMAVAELAKSSDARALPPLIRLLADPDPYLRREVLGCLAKRDDPAIVEPLVTALSDADDYVRRDAAIALGQLGEMRALEPLEQLTKDGSYSVRDAAERAVKRIREAGASRSGGASAGATPAPSIIRRSVSMSPPLTPGEMPPGNSASTSLRTASDDDASATTAARVTSVIEPERPPDVEPISARESRSARRTADSSESSSVEQAVTNRREQKPGDVAGDVLAAPLPAAAAAMDDRPEYADRLLPEGFEWSRARRMPIFFAGDLEEVQSVYQRLDTLRQALLEAERTYRTTFLKQGLAEADKRDDLERCEEELEEAREALRKREREAAKVQRKKTQFEAEQQAFWNQLMTSFSNDAQSESRRQQEELQDRLQRLEGEIRERREKVKTLETSYDELHAPLESLRDQAAEQKAERDKAAVRVHHADQSINARIVGVFEEAMPRDLKDRLDRLAKMANDAPFFRACAGELTRWLATAHATAEAAEQAAADEQAASEMARQSLDMLGAALATGFRVSASERKAAVRLHGKVTVREQRPTFGGYSGADGTLSGSGSGEAMYAVEEVRWEPTADLSQQAAGFTAAWIACGESSARRQCEYAMTSANRQIILEYAYWIRQQLECDFREFRS